MQKCHARVEPGFQEMDDASSSLVEGGVRPRGRIVLVVGCGDSSFRESRKITWAVSGSHIGCHNTLLVAACC